MSKRSRRKGPPKANHQRPRQRRRRQPQSSGGNDLLRSLALALAQDDPLPILTTASSALGFDPSRYGLRRPSPDEETTSADELLAGLFDVPLLETSAVLTAAAALRGDELFARRVRNEVVGRGHVLPDWLARLDRTVVGHTVELRDPLRDGDDVILGLQLPGGHDLTTVVYVDYNMGTLVKDAFVISSPIDDIVRLMRREGDPDATYVDIDPADARARIIEAIEAWSITVPPVESDEWPACRPMVEWALDLLPEGGTGYQRPAWSKKELAALTKRFLASPLAAGFDEDHRGLLEDLLWYGTDYGSGDPLRLSQVNVEILLLDWVPRKIVADVKYLAKFPELLRAFIRFSHAEAGIRNELTEETLDAVDEWELEYQRTIRSPRPQGPAALLARMGVGDPADLITDEMLAGLRREQLANAVGGDETLAALGAEPLPDEPFDWARVPDDVHDRVAEVLPLVDRCCDALFDVEVRTAARRALAAVAAGDPEIFRRRGRADTAAAAICWMVGQANDLFLGGRTVKEMVALLGVGSGTPAQRARPMLAAIGSDYVGYGPVSLASPDYLIAEQRREIIRIRDEAWHS